MALDIAGLHHEAEDAYEWLAPIQRDDGSWHNYYWPDGSVEESKLDTNVCAYIATGVWHHWRCTWDRGFLDHLWPTVERALDWVLAQRRADGLALWAIEADGTRPWSYALLTGTSCIQHALRCGHALAEAIGEARPGLAPGRRAHDASPSPTGPRRSSRRTGGRWTGTTRC